jgi:hypothetical protein
MPREVSVICRAHLRTARPRAPRAPACVDVSPAPPVADDVVHPHHQHMIPAIQPRHRTQKRPAHMSNDRVAASAAAPHLTRRPGSTLPIRSLSSAHVGYLHVQRGSRDRKIPGRGLRSCAVHRPLSCSPWVGRRPVGDSGRQSQWLVDENSEGGLHALESANCGPRGDPSVGAVPQHHVRILEHPLRPRASHPPVRRFDATSCSASSSDRTATAS